MRTIPELAADLWAGWNNPEAAQLADSLTDRERALILTAHQVGQQRREPVSDVDEIIRDVCRAAADTPASDVRPLNLTPCPGCGLTSSGTTAGCGDCAKRASTGLTYLWVHCELAGTLADYSVEYSCVDTPHQARREAVDAGLRALDHDDFRILTLRDGLVWGIGLGAGDDAVDFDPAEEDLAGIARQLCIELHPEACRKAS